MLPVERAGSRHDGTGIRTEVGALKIRHQALHK